MRLLGGGLLSFGGIGRTLCLCGCLLLYLRGCRSGLFFALRLLCLCHNRRVTTCATEGFGNGFTRLLGVLVYSVAGGWEGDGCDADALGIFSRPVRIFNKIFAFLLGRRSNRIYVYGKSGCNLCLLVIVSVKRLVSLLLKTASLGERGLCLNGFFINGGEVGDCVFDIFSCDGKFCFGIGKYFARLLHALAFRSRFFKFFVCLGVRLGCFLECNQCTVNHAFLLLDALLQVCGGGGSGTCFRSGRNRQRTRKCGYFFSFPSGFHIVFRNGCGFHSACLLCSLLASVIGLNLFLQCVTDFARSTVHIVLSRVVNHLAHIFDNLQADIQFFCKTFGRTARIGFRKTAYFLDFTTKCLMLCLLRLDICARFLLRLFAKFLLHITLCLGNSRLMLCIFLIGDTADGNHRRYTLTRGRRNFYTILGLLCSAFGRCDIHRRCRYLTRISEVRVFAITKHIRATATHHFAHRACNALACFSGKSLLTLCIFTVMSFLARCSGIFLSNHQFKRASVRFCLTGFCLGTTRIGFRTACICFRTLDTHLTNQLHHAIVLGLHRGLRLGLGLWRRLRHKGRHHKRIGRCEIGFRFGLFLIDNLDAIVLFLFFLFLGNVNIRSIDTQRLCGRGGTLVASLEFIKSTLTRCFFCCFFGGFFGYFRGLFGYGRFLDWGLLDWSLFCRVGILGILRLLTHCAQNFLCLCVLGVKFCLLLTDGFLNSRLALFSFARLCLGSCLRLFGLFLLACLGSFALHTLTIVFCVRELREFTLCDRFRCLCRLTSLALGLTHSGLCACFRLANLRACLFATLLRCLRCSTNSLLCVGKSGCDFLGGGSRYWGLG